MIMANLHILPKIMYEITTNTKQKVHIKEIIMMEMIGNTVADVDEKNVVVEREIDIILMNP